MRITKYRRIRKGVGRLGSTVMTFVRKGEGIDITHPPEAGTTEKEFQKRLKRAAKKKPAVHQAPVTVNPALDYQALCAKYAAELEHGRQLQSEMFGKDKWDHILAERQMEAAKRFGPIRRKR